MHKGNTIKHGFCKPKCIKTSDNVKVLSLSYTNNLAKTLGIEKFLMLNMEYLAAYHSHTTGAEKDF